MPGNLEVVSDVRAPALLPGEVCRPVLDIEGNGDLARVCDDAEHLLLKVGAAIYQRGGVLVRIVREAADQPGLKRDVSAPRIVPFDDLSLCDVITRHIEVRKRNRKTQDLVCVDCPRVVAQTILARKEWRFRYLEALVEHPVVLEDGRVLWESGYHAESGILLDIEPFTFQSPYDDPDKDYAQEHLARLCELLGGFAFVDKLDLSVALAFLLTPFVRPLLQTAPAFAFDAHAAGSGKSTLVRTGAVMSTGREPAFLTYGDDPVELEKLLFAALLAGDQQIAMDNVIGSVRGAVLAVILTSAIYRGRVLGQSATATVPTKAVISMNGNNLQIVGDLTRRTLVCRIDPECERPAEREFAFDPVEEVRSMRSEYVLHALTIMQAYIASGDCVQLRPFGSFEAWSRLVREPLVWLGLPDPVDSIRVLEAADPEREQLRAMLTSVESVFERREFKATEAIHASQARRQAELGGGPVPSDDQREALAEALQAVCERNGELNSKALGRWLLGMQGRIEGGMRFVRIREARGGAMWRIERKV